MKGPTVILFCAASAGCALVSPPVPASYSEAPFPGAVNLALANQACASIVNDFNPRHVRLGFVSGFDRFTIAARLETLLRENGYEVTTETRRTDAAKKQPEEREDTAIIAYSTQPASPGYLYFTISVGPDWRLSRVYSYTHDGQIDPHTPATIKRNGFNAR